jgi:CPA1 family monovalent cation:H+ antiporter
MLPITQILVFFLSCLFMAALCKPIADRLAIPFPALLVILGFLSSEWLVGQGIDTGLRWDSFHDLVFYIFLPILVYNAALRLNADYFFRNIATILLLAIPLMLLTTFITAYILFYGVGQPEGYPLLAALITAAILSALDPSAILIVLKRMRMPTKVTAILEGEGLFSGAMAIVLSSLFVGIAVSSQEQSLSAGQGFLEFARVFSGGILVGLLLGIAAWLLVALIKDNIVRGILSLVTAYSSFLIAEYYLQVSGIIAVLVTGLMLNAFVQKVDRPSRQFLMSLWEYKANIANMLLFIILGASIQYSILAEQWLAIVIGIVATLVARWVAIYLGLGFFRFLPGLHRHSPAEKFTLLWGGLRGAVTIALVLSLPESLPYYSTIQGIVYGVVLFTLFIQAPSLKLSGYWTSH